MHGDVSLNVSLLSVKADMKHRLLLWTLKVKSCSYLLLSTDSYL